VRTSLLASENDGNVSSHDQFTLISSAELDLYPEFLYKLTVYREDLPPDFKDGSPRSGFNARIRLREKHRSMAVKYSFLREFFENSAIR